ILEPGELWRPEVLKIHPRERIDDINDGRKPEENHEEKHHRADEAPPFPPAQLFGPRHSRLFRRTHQCAPRLWIVGIAAGIAKGPLTRLLAHSAQRRLSGPSTSFACNLLGLESKTGAVPWPGPAPVPETPYFSSLAMPALTLARAASSVSCPDQ